MLEVIGMPTPVIDAVILAESTITKGDYRKEKPLTPSTLDIDKMSAKEMNCCLVSIELMY